MQLSQVESTRTVEGYVVTFSGIDFTRTGSGFDIVVALKDIRAEKHTPVSLVAPSAKLSVFWAKPLEVQLITDVLPSAVVSKTTDSLNHFIALRMSELPVVERVYSKYQGRVFYTWIVIEKRDQQVLREIYKREKEIIHRFQEFGFDFYVIYRSGADIGSLISGDVDLVFEREV
jgi:hypothetical protein